MLLTSRHLLRILSGLVRETDQIKFLHGKVATLRTGHASNFQPEFHVLQGCHMRKQRIRLEHHGHVTLVDGHTGHILAADENTAGLNVLQPGKRAQCSGLAATGAAEQYDHLSRLDFQVEIIKCLHVRTGVDLIDAQHLHAATARLGILEHGLGGFGHHVGVGFDIGERFCGMCHHRFLFGKRHYLSPSLDRRIASEIRSRATSRITPNNSANSDIAVEIWELDWPS